MALFRRGSFSDFAATISAPPGVADAGGDIAGLESLDTVASVAQATRTIQPATLSFPVSPDRRGLAVKAIRLTKGAEGFLAELFKPENEVYFLAWTWDLSGEAPVLYPGKVTDPPNSIIELKEGQVREFISEGAVLFPQRPVTAGIALRIQVWESDDRARSFGKTLSEVAEKVEESELKSVLEAIALAGGPTTATLAIVEKASLELAQAIGTVLQANSDDYLDFYEGYYSATEEWAHGEETYEGNATQLTLSRFS